MNERTQTALTGFSAAAEGAPYYFEKVISYMFWADIALNFRTGYVRALHGPYIWCNMQRCALPRCIVQPAACSVPQRRCCVAQPPS